MRLHLRNYLKKEFICKMHFGSHANLVSAISTFSRAFLHHKGQHKATKLYHEHSISIFFLKQKKYVINAEIIERYDLWIFYLQLMSFLSDKDMSLCIQCTNNKRFHGGRDCHPSQF